MVETLWTDEQKNAARILALNLPTSGRDIDRICLKMQHFAPLFCGHFLGRMMQTEVRPVPVLEDDEEAPRG